jgi:hypothetical protein
MNWQSVVFSIVGFVDLDLVQLTGQGVELFWTPQEGNLPDPFLWGGFGLGATLDVIKEFHLG